MCWRGATGSASGWSAAKIRSTRGQISVRDREGLKAMAGESYGAAEAEYQRLVAPFGRDAN
jgi:hypothetical protein